MQDTKKRSTQDQAGACRDIAKHPRWLEAVRMREKLAAYRKEVCARRRSGRQFVRFGTQCEWTCRAGFAVGEKRSPQP